MIAELHDWLNRKVLSMELNGKALHLKVKHQRRVFVDNQVGWAYRNDGEISSSLPSFDLDVVKDFAFEAQEWAQLPIERLGQVRFLGLWRFACNDEFHLDFEIGPYADTPSKTDWMMARVWLRNGDFRYSEKLHIDYSSLEEFSAGIAQTVREADGLGTSGADLPSDGTIENATP